MNTLAVTSPARRRTDRLARLTLLAGLLVALVPLVLVLLFVIIRGAGALNLHFFTTDPTGAFFGDQGGIRSAILGTIEIVALATAIAVPVGIALAVYLNEVGRQSKLAVAVRYFIDVLTGVPSIVFGLFIYIVFVLGNVLGGFAAWKGSIALALLMLPVVARASEVSLALVPDSLREAALALGAPGGIADGGSRLGDRRLASDRQGLRGDGPAAVHGTGRPGYHLLVRRADELAAAADL